MKKAIIHSAFLAILAITIFSLWAAFALLVVNHNYHEDLPGYVIGRVCIWEGVAFVVAILIAYGMIRSWGYPVLEFTKERSTFAMNKNFAIYFFGYFLLAIVIAIWQFWLFSQNF